MDDELGEWIDLREDCRDQAVSGVKLFVVVTFSSEITDAVQLDLVALLGYDLEVLEDFVQVSECCLRLGLLSFLLAPFSVLLELLSDVVVVVLHVLKELLLFFEGLIIFEECSKLEGLGNANTGSVLNESVNSFLITIFASHGVKLLI